MKEPRGERMSRPHIATTTATLHVATASIVPSGSPTLIYGAEGYSKWKEWGHFYLKRIPAISDNGK